MLKQINRKEQTRKRHQRVRLKISGDAQWPRLAVYRSTKHIYAQVIDDVNQTTLVSASTLDEELKGKLNGTGNKEAAKAVGELVAKRAIEKGIKEVVFDRGGYIYHGRVKELADAAREAGLEF